MSAFTDPLCPTCGEVLDGDENECAGCGSHPEECGCDDCEAAESTEEAEEIYDSMWREGE